MNLNPQINFPLWLRGFIPSSLPEQKKKKKKQKMMFGRREKQVQEARLQTHITVIRIKASIPRRLISQ